MDVVVPPASHAAALWSGLLLLVLLVLSLLVVRQRQRHNVLIGDDGVPDLVRATRAFGNAAEYTPAGIAGLAVLAVSGANVFAIHGIGALLLLGRVAHGFGLSRSAGVSLGRLTGTVMTWLAFLIAAALLLFYSVP